MDWVGIIIWSLSFLAIGLLAAAVSDQLNSSLKPHEWLIKAVAFGVLIFCGMYWYLDVPLTGYIRDLEPLPEVGNIESITDIQEKLQILRSRIDILEGDLHKQRKQSEQLIRHYEKILFLAWFAILMLGSHMIFGKKNTDRRDPPNDMIKLDLDKFRVD